MPAIESYGLTRNFGQITAVEDLNFEVAEGEILAFLGPNGAGKTTTIRMLAGIIAATSGYAIVAGHRTDKDIDRLHQDIGLLTEAPGLYDRLSARRNLEYFAGFYPGLDSVAQAQKYLKVVGLEERSEDRVGTFSKGMKQRLALARALLPEPKVLFLDEPTSGLDPEAAREVRELIANLGREGRTIFISTHNLTEAEQLCHRIAVVRTRMVALDSPENLRQRLFQREVVIQMESITRQILDTVTGLSFVRKAVPEGKDLVVELDDALSQRPELVKGIVERSIVKASRSIEQ